MTTPSAPISHWRDNCGSREAEYLVTKITTGAATQIEVCNITDAARRWLTSIGAKRDGAIWSIVVRPGESQFEIENLLRGIRHVGLVWRWR